MDFYVQRWGGEPERNRAIRACWRSVAQTHGPQSCGGAGDWRANSAVGIIERVNRFFEWIGLKEKLHRSDHKPPFVSERDLWWASLGQNVGSEVNGKSGRFSRPVLVMRKFAHGFYLVAPTTTKQREGTWYVHVRLGNQDEYVCLIRSGRSIIADCLPRSARSIPTTSIACGRRFGGSLWGRGCGS